MKCSKCHYENETNIKFCKKCGHDLIKESPLQTNSISSNLYRRNTFN